MNDLFFIFFTVFAVTGMIYVMYKLMLGADKSKDSELQITSKEILEQITILYKQKKYPIVESLATKYLEKKPFDDGIRIILSKALYESKRIYEAIDQAKIVLKHQPHSPSIQIFLANCYVDVQQPMKAIDRLKDVLLHDNNNIVATKEIADLYFKTNQKKSAIKMYEKLGDFLENGLEKAQNKAKIADIHTEFGEYEPAIKHYEDILKIYPDDVNYKKKLLELHKLTLNYASLIDMSAEILNTNSENENGLWAMNMLMEVYINMQNYERALEYANLIKEHPLSDKAEINKEIAEILLEGGKIDDSISLLNALIQKNPEDIELKKALARAYEVNQDFEQATDIYKKILDEADVKDIETIHFEISNIYSNWGIHLFLKNENTECFKCFTTAIQYCDHNPEIYARLGNINKIIKNFNEAISQYKKAIELDEENPEYHYELAECYKEIDSVYEEKKTLQRCLELDSNNEKAYFRLGVILSIQNNYNEAILNIRKALELNSDFIEAKHKLALFLEHQGDKDGAIRLYEDILKHHPDNQEAINNLKILRGS